MKTIIKIGKKKFINNFLKTPLIILFITILGSLHENLKAENKVEASLNPSTIKLGQNTTLKLYLEFDKNDTHTTPRFKKIDGLDITFYSQQSGYSLQSFYSSNNGLQKKVTNNYTYLFNIKALKTGKFIIKPIEIKISKKKYKTKPLTLNVVNNTSQSLQNPYTNHLNSNKNQNNKSSSITSNTKLDPAKLEIKIPTRDYYLGEKIIIQIHAYFHHKIQAQIDQISLDTESFILDKSKLRMDTVYNRPKSEIVNINGTNYKKATWDAVIIPIKTGEFKLKAKLPTTLIYPYSKSSKRKNNSNRFDSFFNDPFFSNKGINIDSFFDDFFNRNTNRTEQVELTTQDKIIKIINLPTKNKPNNFSGAIGNFELSYFNIPNKSKLGEPIKATMQIQGIGNFDKFEQINMNSGKNSTNWKIYDSDTEFTASNNLNTQGKITITIPIVAQKNNIQNTPDLEINYFDPLSKKYSIIKAPKKQFTVINNNKSNITTKYSSNNTLSQDTKINERPSQEDTKNKIKSNALDTNSLAPELKIGTIIHNITPNLIQKKFLISSSFLLALILLGNISIKLFNKPPKEIDFKSKKIVNKHIAKEFNLMKQNLNDNKLIDFLNSAKNAINYKATHHYNKSINEINHSDIEKLFGKESIAKKILNISDKIIYSGKKIENENLHLWLDLLKKEINNIK